VRLIQQQNGSAIPLRPTGGCFNRKFSTMKPAPRLRLARNALLLLCGHVIGLAPLRLRLALMSLPSLVAGENPSSAAQTSILVPHFGWRKTRLGQETGRQQTVGKSSTRNKVYFTLFRMSRSAFSLVTSRLRHANNVLYKLCVEYSAAVEWRRPMPM
jgi:hypothetical protein